MKVEHSLNLLTEHLTYPAILSESSLIVLDPKQGFNHLEKPLLLIENDSSFFKILNIETSFLLGEKHEVTLDLSEDSSPLYIRLQRIEKTPKESLIQLKIITQDEKQKQCLVEQSERLQLVLEGTRLGIA